MFSDLINLICDVYFFRDYFLTKGERGKLIFAYSYDLSKSNPIQGGKLTNSKLKIIIKSDFTRITESRSNEPAAVDCPFLMSKKPSDLRLSSVDLV